MNGRVTAGAPASPLVQVRRMLDLTDKDMAGLTGRLVLGMAAQAEVGVGRHEHLPVYRAVRVVAGGAALAHGFMLENERLGLFAMALRAIFVEARHGQPTRRLEDIAAMRIVALHAVHAAFDDRVVLGQVELGVGFQMAFKAGGRIFARVNDEFAPPAARRNVFAAWAMAGFAPRLAGQFGLIQMNPGVGAGRKDLDHAGVAIQAGLISHIGCAGDVGRSQGRARDRGAGNEQQPERAGDCQQERADDWFAEDLCHQQEGRCPYTNESHEQTLCSSRVMLRRVLTRKVQACQSETGRPFP